jgi:hypothetical protein
MCDLGVANRPGNPPLVLLTPFDEQRLAMHVLERQAI